MNMDPDANFSEQLRLTARINRAREGGPPPSKEDVYRLAELIGALDEWIRHGGYLPASWERRRTIDRKAQ